ncbi:MAG: hypothetical protein WBP03_00420 [Candidatus Saccharimonadales bacterium]|jgi:hypothetical protein
MGTEAFTETEKAYLANLHLWKKSLKASHNLGKLAGLFGIVSAATEGITDSKTLTFAGVSAVGAIASGVFGRRVAQYTAGSPQ